MDLKQEVSQLLEAVKEKKPLIHHITNYVTVNDCANVVLALGGAPVMADEPSEVQEMVSLASALVLNVGTLNQRTIESSVLAGKRANELGIPVILDPVGVGATRLRGEAVKRITEEVQLTVLKGNMSEIKNIYGIEGITRGVDSLDDSREGGKEIAQALAKRLHCIVAITGAIDIVSDGEKVYCIENGHEILSKITGTGCMTASIIGTCLGTKERPLYGALLGIMVMGIAGEIAYDQLNDKGSLGSFRVKLIDALGSFTSEIMDERGLLYEV